MIELIKRPLVTEKAMKLGTQRQYVFVIDPRANKIEVKKAVEDMFDVNVLSVRTLRVKGKVKSRFTKKGLMRGKTPGKKKAIVTLKEGQAIDLVSGEASE